MDFNEFYTIAKEVGGFEYSASVRKTEPDRWGKSAQQAHDAWAEEHKRDARFSAEWVIGGEEGGSCWDTGDEDRHSSISAEPEASLEGLDDLLLKVCPALTFLMYHKLENSLIHSESRRKNDYYGNYTEYAIKYVSIAELYDFLVEYHVI